MNAQQRLLLIFMRLMSGKKVNKYELMEKFDKKESTVQRDIAKIESLLEDEVYGMVSKEKMRIER
ncbi:MAG: HTH domain-containing protein, partial [Vagococcus sp.]|nr:HTH domain-containing protein [Vagococcus sp.]